MSIRGISAIMTMSKPCEVATTSDGVLRQQRHPFKQFYIQLNIFTRLTSHTFYTVCPGTDALHYRCLFVLHIKTARCAETCSA